MTDVKPGVYMTPDFRVFRLDEDKRHGNRLVSRQMLAQCFVPSPSLSKGRKVFVHSFPPSGLPEGHVLERVRFRTVAFGASAESMVRPDWRMGLNEGERFGLKYSFCVRCGLILTDPKSVMYAMGPVCRKEMEKA